VQQKYFTNIVLPSFYYYLLVVEAAINERCGGVNIFSISMIYSAD
jgi:hypothetical protein